MNHVRVLLVALAGTAVICAPFALYAGEVWCKMHHVEPPKSDNFLLAAVSGITTILIFAFRPHPRRGIESDESK